MAQTQSFLDALACRDWGDGSSGDSAGNGGIVGIGANIASAGSLESGLGKSTVVNRSGSIKERYTFEVSAKKPSSCVLKSSFSFA